MTVPRVSKLLLPAALQAPPGLPSSPDPSASSSAAAAVAAARGRRMGSARRAAAGTSNEPSSTCHSPTWPFLSGGRGGRGEGAGEGEVRVSWLHLCT